MPSGKKAAAKAKQDAGKTSKKTKTKVSDAKAIKEFKKSVKHSGCSYAKS